MNEKHDPKYLGIPNINFSLTKENDHREETYKKQRLEQGFDDSETWSLRDTIARFIIPRLKRFNEIIDAPDLEIDKILIAFELVQRNDGAFMLTKEEKEQYIEGMDVFRKNFLGLWW